jgi:hypothetical protein
MKTVRFAQVIAKSGKPETHPLWTSPDKDPVFKAALESHRIMTVHQNTVGSIADHGVVGYDEDAQGTLLIFPRSIKSFANRRVVGIKYDQLVEPKVGKRVRTAKLKLLPKPKSVSSVVRGGNSNAKSLPKKSSKSKRKPEHSPPKKTNAKATADPNTAAKELAQLKAAVKRAMTELQKGKAVSAYQVLEKALVVDG